MSLGFRTKSPTSLTTLVNANMKTNCVQKAYLRPVRSHPSVAFQHDTSRSGSTTKASEVKVAKWRAYVHHGCWLRRVSCQLMLLWEEHETCRRTKVLNEQAARRVARRAGKECAGV